MRKLWLEEAWEEYISWQTKDKAVLKKINRLLKDIDRYGYECSGKPEPLKGIFLGTGVFILTRRIASSFVSMKKKIWKSSSVGRTMGIGKQKTPVFVKRAFLHL